MNMFFYWVSYSNFECCLYLSQDFVIDLIIIHYKYILDSYNYFLWFPWHVLIHFILTMIFYNISLIYFAYA